jgi:uncharacterized protein (TIGR03067 family)
LGAVLAGASPSGAGGAEPVAPSAVAPGEDKPETPADKELKWLAGEWALRHVETNGEAILSKEELKNARIVFKDKKAQVNFDVSYVSDFAFKIDPTKEPREIDVTFLGGAQKGVTVEGIYVVYKDEMRICLRLMSPEFGRPKGFVTNSGTTLYTFILEPVEKKPNPPVIPQPPKPRRDQPPVVDGDPIAKPYKAPEKKPFDADAKKREGYLYGHARGYDWAMGQHLVCPTNPSDENLHAIRGWVEGWQAGVKAGGASDLPAKYAPFLVWKDAGKQ